MDRDLLIAEACESTGLTDFGDDAWLGGLDRLLDSLAAEARLTELGTAIVAAEIVGYLGNRLRITDWRHRHPEVAHSEIHAPIFIVGQPRTGTTILHDLLAQDPALRAPLTWEVDRPCPPPSAAAEQDDPRIVEVQAAIDVAGQLTPGLADFHPVGARRSQECVRITAGDFRSMIFTAQYRIPTYARWLLHEADMSSTYRWHRHYLQHLQSRQAGRRWILKAPAHTWHLPALLAEYPDAVLIETHRDPQRVLASVSALTALLRGMASDETSVAEAAAEHADYIFEALDRSLAARRDGLVRAGQVIDVRYTEFVADPLTTIRGIYNQLGAELRPETEQRMRDFLTAHPSGGGRYSFADTGLSAAALRERVRPYQDYFGVSSEVG